MFHQGYGVEDIAQEAYEGVDKRDAVVDGFNYNRGLSTGDVAVYEDPKSNRVTIGLRGTSKVSDIVPDIGIAADQFKDTKRYKSDKAQVEKVLNLYGKKGVNLVGHSLGATSAATIAQDYGIEADVFNAGSTPLQMERNILKSISCKIAPSQTKCINASKVRHHLIPGDIISLWNLFSPSNVMYHKPKSLNFHSMDNFNGLDI